MIDGLERSIHIARQWAETARNAAGGRAQRVLARLGKLVTAEDFNAVASHYGAHALRSLANALEAEKVAEEGRLDNEPTDPRIESVRCGCGLEVLIRRT